MRVFRCTTILFKLLGLLTFLVLLAACENILDPQLTGERKLAEKRVNAALAGGRPDIAQGALHTFAQQIAAAETRGRAPNRQIESARAYIDQALVHIETLRENQKLDQIAAQVEVYIDDERFLQAGNFVRTSIHELAHSDSMRERLVGMLDHIESRQIALIEHLVQEELDRESFTLARTRVDLALGNSGFSQTGQERLEKLAAKVEAAERAAKATTLPPPAPLPPLPPPASRPPITTARGDGPVVLGLEFARVQAGRYKVGSPKDEQGRDPSREVEPEEHSITEFYISTTEVTQKAFVQVIPRIWQQFSDPSIPAHSVSFSEAEDFCRQLSELDGDWLYDLPSEVEWEVAARALNPPSAGPVNARPSDRVRFSGSLEKAALTLQKYAFFRDNKQRSGPMPVKLKLPNGLGMFDVHGNVAEWCRPVQGLSHWHKGSLVERPTRGGSVLSDYERCRSGARAFEKEGTRKPTIGFRIIARRR